MRHILVLIAQSWACSRVYIGSCCQPQLKTLSDPKCAYLQVDYHNFFQEYSMAYMCVGGTKGSVVFV